MHRHKHSSKGGWYARALGNVRSALCLGENQALPNLVVRPGNRYQSRLSGPKVDCARSCSRGIIADLDGFCILLCWAINTEICAWNARLVAKGAIEIEFNGELMAHTFLTFPFLVLNGLY